jgi:hypothetical protein
MALPTLRALTSLAPDRFHLVLAAGAPRPLFSDLPLLRLSEIATQPTTTSRAFDAGALAQLCGEADLFIAPVPWFSPDMAEFLSDRRPRHSIGFFEGFTVRLPLDFGKHSIDLGFDVVRALAPGAEPDLFSGPIKPPEEDGAFVTRLFKALDNRPVLVAHNETKPDKQLPPAVFAEVLTEFALCNPDWIVIALGRRSCGVGNGGPANLLPVTGLPLGAAIGVISRATLFLGADSFPLHVADLARTPGLGLFGPTDPAEFGFRFNTVGQALRRASMQAFSAAEVLEHLDRRKPAGVATQRRKQA